MDKYTILAPHIDDELIGCFSLFEKREVDSVIYFYDLDEHRKDEARKLQNEYGVNIYFGIGEDYLKKIDPSHTIALPNINDLHPHHKHVNFIGRSLPNKKIYYSIDMNTSFKVLTTKQQRAKKDALLSLYPSQRDLFLSNDKYFLFESLQDNDLLSYIEVKTNFEGFHSYPNAPNEVEFLKNIHRHIFYLELKVQVFHDDREIEFFMLKNKLNTFIKDKGSNLNNKSCEMLCNDFIIFINKEYGQRNVIAKISEDNENAAIVEQIYWK